MRLTFDQLKARAEALQMTIVTMDRELAVLAIIKALLDVKHDAEMQALEEMETRLFHREHH